jgi:hypothetical protein
MDLFLHLGAHRTGSTTFQFYAEKHADALRAADVTVWGPRHTRDGRMEGLIKAADKVTPEIARAGRAACAGLVAQMAEVQTGALLISEENMLGSMFVNAREQSLYPDAARRLVRFRPAFADTCSRVGLAIRSYDRHWASSLSFVLRKEQRGTSSVELAALSAQPRRWRHVVADIADVFPEAEIVVWCCETLVDTPEIALAALVGDRLRHAPLAASDDWHHPSPDSAALRAALPEGAARDSVIGTSGPWVPFDADARARMRAAYAEDIAWLRAGAEGRARFVERPHDTPRERIAGRPG